MHLLIAASLHPATLSNTDRQKEGVFVDKDQIIKMRSIAKDRAKNKCEMCGSTTLLIVRTNLAFSYTDYLKTGEILQRELSVVCERCSYNMIIRAKESSRKQFVEYICLTPRGELLDYQQ